MNFKEGMYVTYTAGTGRKYHGVVEKIELDSPWPIRLFIKCLGWYSFTLDGRLSPGYPIVLKLRDEL